MPEQVLSVLKICLLILIYLFFLRVLRAVWAEVAAVKTTEPAREPGRFKALRSRSSSSSAPVSVRATAPVSSDSLAMTSVVAAVPSSAGTHIPPAPPSWVSVVQPSSLAGRNFSLDAIITIGRDSDSTISISDGFMSFHHARIFLGDGGAMVEDVGSTNGTFVNEQRIDAVQVVNVGDTIRCGNLIMEVR